MPSCFTLGRVSSCTTVNELPNRREYSNFQLIPAQPVEQCYDIPDGVLSLRITTGISAQHLIQLLITLTGGIVRDCLAMMAGIQEIMILN